MRIKQYNKLVRDRIPEIIEESGKKAVIYIADDKEYLEKLYDKLIEEIEEFKENPSPEELADILEVCDAIREYFKIDANEVEYIKKKKFEERGGFYKRIILKEVIVREDEK